MVTSASGYKSPTCPSKINSFKFLAFTLWFKINVLYEVMKFSPIKSAPDHHMEKPYIQVGSEELTGQ